MTDGARRPGPDHDDTAARETRRREIEPDGTVVEVIKRKKKVRGQQMLTALPRVVYYVVAALIVLLLLLVIIAEPFQHKESLPYYHPPGMAPAVPPLR
ncbi:MAG TPA: hypothetical protein PKM88_06025 [bacterium]|nr:hypothetical protein [bacterium]